MTSMDVTTATWCGRGQWVNLVPVDVAYLLQGINDAVLAADRRIQDARGMTGIGFVDRTAAAQDIATGLGILNSYVYGLPGDVGALVDQPLFEVFANGPAEALSRITTDSMTTANTVGVTRTTEVRGKCGPSVQVTSVLSSLSFDDFTGVKTSQTPVPGFADIFQVAYESWLADPGHGEDLDLGGYLDRFVTSGEYDHQGYHPVADFVTGLLDFTIVWPIYKGVTGYDPITGETLGEWERALGVGMAFVDLVALIAALPTGGGSLTGAALLKAGLRTVGRELLVNALATGVAMVTFDVAVALGLPSWAAALVAMGIGLTVTVVGTRYVLQRLNTHGVPVGDPINVDITSNTVANQVDGHIGGIDPAAARVRIADAMSTGTAADSFPALVDDYAAVYGDIVSSNVKWDWITDVSFAADFTKSQKAAIRARALELGYVPTVEVKPVVINDTTYKVPDFASPGLVETELSLPESLWGASDKTQFAWLDEQAGGKLPGYTWHHTEVPGVMQRVPFGIHNVHAHNGGRSPGLWADSPR